MPRCPNCGREVARTEDWACQFCGYPLLSGSYKKIPKTYTELKEEQQGTYEQASPVRRRLEPPPKPEPEPVDEVKAEPELEPEPATELEAEKLPEEPEPEPEPVDEMETESEPKPVAELEPELPPESELELEPEAEPVAEPEPVELPEAKSEPVAEVEPEPAASAIEITAGELLLAYEQNGPAADKKFANKILRVTGVVNRIEAKDSLDIYYITLIDAQKTILLTDVRCFFDKKHGPELNALSLGQTVVVQGKFDGSMINVRMSNCRLIH